MRFFLDTEFDGYKGDLISMALVPLNPAYPEFYVAIAGVTPTDAWVAENVVPVINCKGADADWIYSENWLSEALATYFDKVRTKANNFEMFIEVIADWPDDIARLANAMVKGPGVMVLTPETVTFTLWRVDAYPTELEGAIQHNALWDARALRAKCCG